MSSINPDFITTAPVSKELMKQNLRFARDEINALQSKVDTADLVGLLPNTDITLVVQSALASGKSVLLPPGTYLCGPLTLNTVGQRLMGAGRGRTVLRARDNAHFVTLDGNINAGLEALGVENITLDCTNITTQGYSGLRILFCGRARVASVSVNNCTNGVYVQKCNFVDFDACNIADVTNVGYDIYGHTDANGRTDLVYFSHCIVTGKLSNGQIIPSSIGLLVRGFVNSITLNSFAVVSAGRGIATTATDAEYASGRNPALIYGFDVGVDFSWGENYAFSRVSDVMIHTMYTNNSRISNGVSIDGDCRNFVINGARGGGHALADFTISGKDIKIVNTAVSFSSQGTASEGYGTKLLKYNSVNINAAAENVIIANSQIGGRAGIGATCKHAIYIHPSAKNILITGCDLFGAGDMSIRDLAPVGQTTIGPCRNVPYVINGGMMLTNTRGLFAYAEVTGITNGAITQVTLISRGMMYDAANPPTIRFLSMFGSGATATPVVSSVGEITAINITNGGVNYPADFSQIVLAIDGAPSQPIMAPYSRTANGIDTTVWAGGDFAVNMRNARGMLLRLSGGDNGTYPVLSANSDGSATFSVGGSSTSGDINILPSGLGYVKIGGPANNTAPSGQATRWITVRDASGGLFKLALFPAT